jgi:hypothetical protein
MDFCRVRRRKRDLKMLFGFLSVLLCNLLLFSYQKSIAFTEGVLIRVENQATVIVPAYIANSKRLSKRKLFGMLHECLLSLCKSQKVDTRILLAIPSNQYSLFVGLRPDVEKVQMIPYHSSDCWMTYKTKAYINLLNTTLKNEKNIVFVEGDQIYFRDFRDALPPQIHFDVAFTVTHTGTIEYGYFYVKEYSSNILKLLEEVHSILKKKTPRKARCPYKYSDQQALGEALETPKYMGKKTDFENVYVAKFGLRWLARNANKVRDIPQHKFYRGRGPYRPGTCTAKNNSVFIHFRGGKKAIMVHEPCTHEIYKLQENNVNICIS